jgi:predicted metal-binding membrane protein
VNDGRTPTLHSVQQTFSIAALVIVAATAWAFLVASEGAMMDMTGDGLIMDLMRLMMKPSAAGPYLLAASTMWVVMMIAMMIPAAMPMAVIFRRMDRSAAPNFDTLIFASGYLAGWSCYSIIAALIQWWLHSRGTLHGHVLITSPRLAGAIMIAAGIYQLTPLKEACLNRCRSPLGFFMDHWRDGRIGACLMGLHHGMYCVGCCWVLMLLMFAGGAMSVATMAALSVFILAERLVPAGPLVAKIPGAVLIGWGGLVLWRW